MVDIRKNRNIYNNNKQIFYKLITKTTKKKTTNKIKTKWQQLQKRKFHKTQP